MTRPEAAAWLSGSQLLPGAQPLATVYGGHQFGTWSGRLGDGRAHLLGDADSADGPLEVQLKGSGATPYARFADGRAVLRSSLREFLASEAMHALGIPTTRALSIVGSSLEVQRDGMETAAVVTRLAPSFVRFGTPEHFHAEDDSAHLRLLADHVIAHFRSELRDAAQPYAALLADVCNTTAALVASWQAIGFIHGVMNTDNMSLLGLTLDYGPFAFMDRFDPGRISNRSDTYGRYAFRAQPRIAHWNLYVLADALGPLIGHPDLTRDIVDRHFQPAFDRCYGERMRARLGLMHALPGDDDLIAGTLGLLARERVDYTLFFRTLSRLPGAPVRDERARSDAPLRDLFADREACDAWLIGWRARLAREASRDEPRQTAMLKVNPRYTLRNWMADEVIRDARQGDLRSLHRVLDCLRQPFDDQPALARYAQPPADSACSAPLSCSS
jgi:uncharacterized protein YdiU (UPF0061 family)